MDKIPLDHKDVESILIRSTANRVRNQASALGDLEAKFLQAVDDMVDEGELSWTIDLTEDESLVVGSLVSMKRNLGYRFRYDRVIVRTVDEKGRELKEEVTHELFLTLDHLR